MPRLLLREKIKVLFQITRLIGSRRPPFQSPGHRVPSFDSPQGRTQAPPTLVKPRPILSEKIKVLCQITRLIGSRRTPFQSPGHRLPSFDSPQVHAQAPPTLVKPRLFLREKIKFLCQITQLIGSRRPPFQSPGHRAPSFDSH